MYTELVMAIELKKDVPSQVIKVLSYMVGENGVEPANLPNHPLFKTPRWSFMLNSDSYYFDGITHSELEEDNLFPDHPYYYLSVRCNLKNYDEEIEKFIDWITAFTESSGFVGYKRYEEDEEPTLIYIRKE
jgi:hypothetical protein